MSRWVFVIPMVLTSSVAAAETKVAVMPIQSAGSKVDPGTAQLVTDRLTTEMGKRSDLRVIGSSELQSLVTLEQTRQLTSCTDNSCLAEIGAALGADAMITGSLGNIGELYVINLSMVDSKKATVLARVSEEVSTPEQLIVLIPYLAGSLGAGVPGGPPVPERPVLPKVAPKENPPPTAQKSEEGGSSMPRRLAGLGVAGLGGVGILLALAVGAASVAYLAAGFMHVPVVTTLPGRVGGFGLAGVADAVGLTAFLIFSGGVILALIP